MTAADRCPQCGAFLPSGSPHAACPACLMQLGLLAAHDTPVDDPGPIPELRPTHISPSIDRPVPVASRLPSPADLAQLFPELEIIKLLGFGGMGAVYKARQTGLDRYVALKIIMPDVAGDAGFAERFTREARVLAKLNHPHIVTIHDFGQRTGVHFLIMEYVDGVNLREVLNSGRMSSTEALRIIPRLCEALQYAHEEGVVHRDIKPENILIDRKGRVKVADFGLARLAGRDSENYTLTGTRQVVGTPRYMAPEQMQGARAVDHRADIYSLGVVFYEMLTGEVPLGRFPPPSHHGPMDARLDDVVLRALDSNPDRRYQHASEIQTDVEAISHGRFVPPPPLPASHSTRSANLFWPALFQSIVGCLQIFLSFTLFVILADSRWTKSSPESMGMFVMGLLGGLTGAVAVGGAIHWFMTGSVRQLQMGARLLLFPFNYTWFLGLPAAIWTLTASAQQHSTNVPRSQDRTAAFTVIAVVQLLLGIVQPAVILFLSWFVARPIPHQSGMVDTQPIVLVLLVLLSIVLVSLVMAISAIGYLAGGSPRWLFPGAIGMLLPISPGCIIGIPLGIWYLILLKQEAHAPRFAVANDIVQTPVRTPVPPTSTAPAVSDQISVPWSGFGWVQKAVRKVPKRNRWPLFLAGLVVALLIWLGTVALSSSSLLAAVKAGNAPAVRFCLMLGGNLESRDENGMTPLLWAVWQRRQDLVRQLLAAGADVHQRSDDGETALMKAAYVGEINILDQLLNAHATVNDADNDGETPLALAASKGNTAIVQKLLEEGADRKAATNKGWTPLIAAAVNGHDSIVNQLLPGSNIDGTDQRGESALMKAAARGHVTVVNTLITHDASLDLTNVDGASALTLAIEGGQPACVDQLIQAGAKSNALVPFFRGFLAARKGQLAQAVTLLRQAAQDPMMDTQSWRFGINNRRYEIESAQCFIWMLICECEGRQNNWDAARETLKRPELNGGGTISLYRRNVDELGHTVREHVQVTAQEVAEHLKNASRPWRLLRNISEQTVENGRMHTQSSNGEYTPASLFD